jgi:hypothetical protein
MEHWMPKQIQVRGIRFTTEADQKICEAAKLLRLSYPDFIRMATLNRAERVLKRFEQRGRRSTGRAPSMSDAVEKETLGPIKPERLRDPMPSVKRPTRELSKKGSA